MSAPINDGGPAFPTLSEHQVSLHTWQHEGMTLRDFFAAAALTGWCATSSQVGGTPLNSSPEHRKTMAKTCYGFADAMLAERAKETKP